MSEKKNRAILFANWPVGLPKLDHDFQLVETTLPSLQDGEILVKTLFLSVDPYMRGRMKNVKSYSASFEIGKPIYGGGVGEVIESKNETYAVGDIITGFLHWADYNVFTKAQTSSIHGKIPKNFPFPLSYNIGVLGMPGMTAYFGFLEICDPKPGETLVVSGAAGAVGFLVGQIGKIKGCRVIGIAGTDEKVKLLESAGFDVGINYKIGDRNKTTEEIFSDIKNAAPNGVDMYFDNVGGDISSAVYQNINRFGRVSLCGNISNYNLTDGPKGPNHDWIFITRSVKLQGFIVTQWANKYPEGMKQMLEWLKEGKIKYEETIRHGLENTPKALLEMFAGENIGKMVVKLA